MYSIVDENKKSDFEKVKKDLRDVETKVLFEQTIQKLIPYANKSKDARSEDDKVDIWQGVVNMYDFGKQLDGYYLPIAGNVVRILGHSVEEVEGFLSSSETEALKELRSNPDIDRVKTPDGVIIAKKGFKLNPNPNIRNLSSKERE